MTAAAIYAPAEKIWQRVLRRVEVDNDGCWIWMGTVNSRGYGCVGAGKSSRTVLVHRVAVMVRDGGIPEGMTVDHMCHQSEVCRLADDCPHRRCVNPEHLAVVTLADNIRRQWEAGKCRKGHPLRDKKHSRYCPQCSHGTHKNNSVTSSDYWRARREGIQEQPVEVDDSIDVRSLLDELFPPA